jgi:hypothetical protein
MSMIPKKSMCIPKDIVQVKTLYLVRVQMYLLKILLVIFISISVFMEICSRHPERVKVLKCLILSELNVAVKKGSKKL